MMMSRKACLNHEKYGHGRKDRRFLVIDPIQFILVEPEVKRIGWGIVKLSDLIQVSLSFRTVLLLLESKRLMTKSCCAFFWSEGRGSDPWERWQSLAQHHHQKVVHERQWQAGDNFELDFHIRRSHSMHGCQTAFDSIPRPVISFSFHHLQQFLCNSLSICELMESVFILFWSPERDEWSWKR